MTALQAAERIRAELTDGSVFRRPRVALDQANWTVGRRQARLQVPVAAADRDLGVRILHVGLVWKNDGWWVDSVALEAAP